MSLLSRTVTYVIDGPVRQKRRLLVALKMLVVCRASKCYGKIQYQVVLIVHLATYIEVAFDERISRIRIKISRRLDGFVYNSKNVRIISH